MKVLVVHNDYRSAAPSGENIAVRNQLTLLGHAGVAALAYIRSSDEVAGRSLARRATLPADVLRGRDATRELAEIINAERPDVVHLHNVYPLISPRVVSAAHERGAAVVATAHNYRRECVRGTFFRDGHDCRECTSAPASRPPLPAVNHACYHDSRAQSAVMAIAQWRHRPYFDEVDRWIALTPAMADYLAGTGIPPTDIAVVPNTVPDPPDHTSAHASGGVLFAGRLVEEKGVRVLLAAYDTLSEDPEHRLTIAGDGPLRAEVEAFAARRSDIRYVGSVPAADMPALIAESAVVAVPSLWADVCPLVVVEALAAGRAVLGSARGGLPWMIGDAAGVVVEPSAAEVADGIRRLTDRDAAELSGLAAHERFAAEFHPDVVTRRLLTTYEGAIETARVRTAGTGRLR